MNQEFPPESKDPLTTPGAPDVMCGAIGGEDPASVTGYAEAFLAEHAPAGPTGGFLVEILASTAWRRRRFERMERGILNDGRFDHLQDSYLKPLRRSEKLRPREREELECLALGRAFMDRHRQIGRLVHIEDTCERSFLRSLRHLRECEPAIKKSAQAA